MPYDKNNLSETEETAGSFEGISNGNNHWESAALEKWLGYKPRSAGFKHAITRAIGVCTNLKIPTQKHFNQMLGDEFKLTRFACYLIAMNGDPKKLQVARAQAYFAQMADGARIRELCEKTPSDFMSKRKLAANLFCITEAEGRIKSAPSIRGQKQLEKIAEEVRREVHDIMEKSFLTGKT